MTKTDKPIKLNKDGTPRKVTEYVPETIDTFFGVNFDTERYNEIAILVANKPLLKAETELNKTKWFDYRTKHPVYLGYLWAFFYREEYKRFITKYRDPERGPYLNGIVGKDVFGISIKKVKSKIKGEPSTEVEKPHPERRAIWKARQKADALGIPYDFYIRTVMEFAERTSWARPPRPQHFCSDEMVSVVVEAWKEKMTTQIVTSEDERFLAENFVGNCDQVDYQTWLIANIKRRAHKHFGVHYCMVLKKQLLENVAIKVFGEDVVKKAKLLELN